MPTFGSSNIITGYCIDMDSPFGLTRQSKLQQSQRLGCACRLTCQILAAWCRVGFCCTVRSSVQVPGRALSESPRISPMRCVFVDAGLPTPGKSRFECLPQETQARRQSDDMVTAPDRGRRLCTLSPCVALVRRGRLTRCVMWCWAPGRSEGSLGLACSKQDATSH